VVAPKRGRAARLPDCAAVKYFRAIKSGKVTACRKMRRLADRMLDEIAHGYKEWHFDKEAAQRPVRFIEEYCYIPSGKLRVPFKLELFQKALVECAFGFVDKDGNRRFQEVLCIMGRKNGKSSLLAALELYALIGDREGAPQVYNVANSEDQAKLAFNAAMRIMRQSKRIRKYARKRADDIYCERNLGFIKPLTSQTANLDGLDVHFGVIDELSAIRNRDLYDLVKQGMSARDQPMLFVITTNGFVRNGVFDAQYDYARGWLNGDVEDDRFLAFIYELDERDEWVNECAWVKANPGLGTIKKLSALRGYVNKALQDPTFRPTVMVKDFNMPENQSVAWLEFDDAVCEEAFDIDEMGFRYGIAGFDAAETTDLTAACMLMMRPGDDRVYASAMYWLPEDALRCESESGSRRERDDVPWEQWVARGLVRLVPGNKVDKRVVLEWLAEMRDEHDVYTYAIGYDPWHLSDDSMRDGFESFVGKARAIPVRQGPATLSQPMKQIKADYRANRIVDNHNPVTEWCRMNVMVRTDVNGNIQPDKKMAQAANRIDGFMAELDAYTMLDKLMGEYSQAI